MKKGRNQWHPGYCGAIELGLRADREYLKFDKEHLLNSAPLKMDLFIVKKKSDIVTQNSIGKIFRRYNIVEFKSPDDALNYDTYIKVVAYACLYKASEKHVGEVSMKDITLTFLRSRVPRKLFRELESEGYRLTYPYPGIYYLQREGFLPMQIIIPDRLEDADSIWLKSLTNRVEQDTLKLMVAATRELRDKGDMDNADAVIQVSAKANPRMYSEMKEDDNVCEALRELMKPEFDEALDKAVNEAVNEAVKEAKKEEASTIFDILAQLKDGIQKERLIEQGYDKQVVERAYSMLFQ